MEVKEWRDRARVKIRNAVCNARRISMRELQRKTNFSRGPVGLEEPTRAWYEALESLMKAGKLRIETTDGKRLQLWETEFRQSLVIVWMEGKSGRDGDHRLTKVRSSAPPI